MHARTHTYCMPCHEHFPNRSENFLLRAIDAALEAPAPITHTMGGIPVRLGSESRHFGDLALLTDILPSRLKAWIPILFNA